MVEKNLLNKSSSSFSDRIYYLDVLRIFSIVCVIAGHTAIQIIDGRTAAEKLTIITSSTKWLLAVFLDNYFLCCVPLFIMISGALNLKKEITIHKLFSKYILRFGISYIFWGMVYSILYGEKYLLSIMKASIYGISRFAFIGTITFIYLITPLLKIIVDDCCKCHYLMIICVWGGMIIPQIANIMIETPIHILNELGEGILFLLSRFNISSILGMIGYYIIGFWLSELPLFGKKCIKWFFWLSMLSAGVSGVLSVILSKSRGYLFHSFMHYNTINVLFYSCLLFVMFKEIAFSMKDSKGVWRKLSGLTYGVFLIHTYFLDYFIPVKLRISAMSFNPLVSIPLLVTITYGISLIIIYILSKIPIINKYVV